MIPHYVYPTDIIELICGEIKVIEKYSDDFYGYYSVDEDTIYLNEIGSIKPEDLLIAAHEAFHAYRFRTKLISINELIKNACKEELIVQNLAEKWCLDNLDPDLYDFDKIISFSNEFKENFR